MKTINRKAFTAAVLALMMVMATFLAACSNNNSGGSDDEKRVLRIATLYGDGGYNEGMRSQYTDLFEFTHKNIEIEFVSAVNWNEIYMTRSSDQPYEEPDPSEAMKALIEGDNPPDIVFVDQTVLADMVNENLLQSLETYIQNDEFDIEDFVPTVIEGLREIGNGELYALAPTFSPSALVYNKDMFDEAGIEYPTDNMTWDQVFEKAQLVSAHFAGAPEKKFGFAFSSYSNSMNLYDDMRYYTAPLGLRMFDDEGKTMLVDTPEWEQVWTQMIELKKQNVFPEPPDYSNMPDGGYSRYFDHAFLSGRTAMMLLSYGQINEITTAMQLGDQIQGFTPFAWDVVTYPVHAAQPDVGGFMSMDPIMGIAANAQNTEDAWEFIQFINGTEWAELKSKSSYNMVARKSYIEQPAGMNINLAAFYTLKPGPDPYGEMNKNGQNYWEVYSIAYDVFNQVLQEQITVKEGLQQWKTRGDEVLQRMSQEQSDSASDGAVTLPVK
ncbi:ABC transporter substrate-binding protein [Marinicrinis lubricantis]|uniref:ABC transporter substrate-binding protein n=1 Tax=Marinicrinis lubricantis TaxID=2086470 RepID=A0ABW1ISD9_9BACL